MSARMPTSREVVAVVLALGMPLACRQDTAPSEALPRDALAPAITTDTDPVIVAAGDLVCNSSTSTSTTCLQAQTAALVPAINPAAVLLLGDLQYQVGSLSEFNTWFQPTWGAHKAITYPAAGNHEYQTAGAQGYFDYFNGVGVQTGRAGERSTGYYSYDAGSWHLVALNSNCSLIGGCGAGSAQETWLRADLAASAASCTLAYWHHPRFSSGSAGNNTNMQALWQALYDLGADLVLAGHDHSYERFGPQTATGVADATRGIRSFVVGTGGRELRAFGSVKANSQLRSSSAIGVLKLVLHPAS